jgi:hypothetical protein
MADTFNKRFDVSDVFVSPYEANKHYDIVSASFNSAKNTFIVIIFSPDKFSSCDSSKEN